MDDFWQTFFSNYGPEEAMTEDDLFRQVAKTKNKQPIPKESFRKSVLYIEDRMKLSESDFLLDFCCGNGLITYELARRVAYVIGIDFVPRNIRTARKWKSAKNIMYIEGEVKEPLQTLIGKDMFPNKFLMSGSLAYFEPSGLDLILNNILKQLGNRSFLFLLTDIPCFDLKWNFYDTPDRIRRHNENEKKNENINDGVGRWWKKKEIEDICSRKGIKVEVTDRPPDLSKYRMDALIQPR